ncbi:MAG: zinc-ribbon domain-containing protein [Myxococcota bacterium]
MTARCPHCQTRYRIARERLGSEGARLRCRRCRTVFRVTPPAPAVSGRTIHALERVEAPARPDAIPSGPATAVVADSDPALAQASRELLEAFGIRTLSIDHGTDALLQIVRRPPTLVVLGGRLTGIPAPALAELIRRNPALASVRMIRIAPIDAPAGVPEFEADETLEPASALSGLDAALRRLGIGCPPVSKPTPSPEAAKAVSPADPEPAAPASSEPAAPAEPKHASPAPAAPPAPDLAVAAPPAEAAAEPPAPPAELAAAERLARIAVSDIVLYNEDKFRKAVEQGAIPGAFGAELDEARQMFCKRIPESIRRQRDFLTEELVRRAEKLAQAG